MPHTAVVDTNGDGAVLYVLFSTIVADNGLRLGDNNGAVIVSSTIINGDVNDVGSDAIRLDAGNAVNLFWSIISSALDGTVFNNGGNQFGIVDPKLGPLADNGGPTLTMIPLAGSPAINAGDPGVSGQPAFDQRGTGFVRIASGRIDIGAVELSTLAATGATIALWVPVTGGLLVLGGIVAVVIVSMRRRPVG